MLRLLPAAAANANVLVGLDTPDDAGVYQLTPDIALVQTVDFFTPIVDDPYAFGQIAAANALSDVYAMGGQPITALNLVGFPITRLPHAVLAEILRGGSDKAREAGVAIIGGHSIDDAEPKYGMAVTGLVRPDAVCTKGGARPGDVLILTKPIGLGTITTAIKRGAAPAEVEAEAVRVMSALNNVVDVLAPFAVRGVTDVTGFGLLGHAQEMARESGVGLVLRAGQVPVLSAAWEFAEQDIFPGGSRSNRRWLEDKVEYAPAVPEVARKLLCDAVTSGGLLLAVPAEHAAGLSAALLERGALAAGVIGECVADHPGRIAVHP